MIAALKSLAYHIKPLRIGMNTGGKRARSPVLESDAGHGARDIHPDPLILTSLRITILIVRDGSQFTSEI